MNTLQSSERGIMTKLFTRMLASAAALTFGLAAYGQTPSATPAAQTGFPVVSVIGEVKSIDASAKQMIVRADSGGALATVNLSERTQYLRIAPGETSLSKATKIALTDVGEGDRVLAQGRGTDQKSFPALRVVLMTKADIAKKQDQERAEWRRRGVLGRVSSLNAATKEITITSRTLIGTSQSIIIPVTDKVMMRRYPPDEIPKFSAAKPSKFEDVKVGDQLRALGDKSADGTHLTAEEIVSGSFDIVGGTVIAIDAATGEVKIAALQTKKPTTVLIKP